MSSSSIPDVAVIVPRYNDTDWLSPCLSGLAEIAIRELFRHASRAKRSKTLAVVKALEAEPMVEGRIQAELQAIQPAAPENEANALTDFINSGPFYAPPKLRAAITPTAPKAMPAGVQLKTGNGRIELSGTSVDAAFIADLKAWLVDCERE